MAKRVLFSILVLVALIGLTSCAFGADDQKADDQAVDDQATEDQAIDDQATEDQATPDQAVVVDDQPKPPEPPKPKKMDRASETVIIIGSSHDSWEDAVHAAVEKAEKCYDNVKIVQIGRLDAKLDDNDNGPSGLDGKNDKDKIEFTAAVEFSYKEDRTP